VVEEPDNIGDVPVDMVRLGAARLIAQAVTPMVEEDASVALRQWIEVASRPPKSRIAPGSEMQNKR
jgi:hypothetical protein